MNVKSVKENVDSWLSSADGHNILVFFVFVIISALFWILMALNDEIQKDISIPVKIENVPEDVTMLYSESMKFDLSVRDKGSALLKYQLGKRAELKFDFASLRASRNQLVINTQDAATALRNIFGQGAITSINPDSIVIPFTRIAPVKVAVDINLSDINTNPRFVISDIIISPDSVLLYSTSDDAIGYTSITTLPITLKEIDDTVSVCAKISTQSGFYPQPEEVNVTFCVVPLITAHRKVDITIINAPENKTVVTFPAQADVSYLVPMDFFKSDDLSIAIVADYEKRSFITPKLPLRIESHSDIIRNVTLDVDSVEYLIE